MINNDVDYVTVQGTDCFSACVVNYLNYVGIDISSGIICVWGGGFNQSFTNEDNTFRITCDMPDAVRNFLKEHDGKLIEANANNDIAEKFLKDNVDNENKIMIAVRTDNFDYDDIFKQSQSWSHCVNIIGYDDNGFIISDGYVPSMVPKTYQGGLSYEKTIEAWKKDDYYYMIFNFEDFNAADFHNKSILRKKLKQQLTAFIEADKKDSRNGFGAFKFLLDSIQASYTLKEFINISQKINNDLKVYGFFSIRASLLLLLDEIDDTSEFYERYNDIFKKYHKFCILLLKLGFSRSEKDFNKLMSFAYDVFDTEKQFFYDLIEKL